MCRHSPSKYERGYYCRHAIRITRQMRIFVTCALGLWPTIAVAILIPSSNEACELYLSNCANPGESLPPSAVRRINVQVGRTRDGLARGLMAVAWSPNGKMVACRCSDNTVRLF